MDKMAIAKSYQGYICKICPNDQAFHWIIKGLSAAQTSGKPCNMQRAAAVTHSVLWPSFCTAVCSLNRLTAHWLLHWP